VKRQTLSIRQVAAILGISPRHAYDLAKSGELRAIRLGRRVVVPVAEVEALLGRPLEAEEEPPARAGAGE